MSLRFRAANYGEALAEGIRLARGEIVATFDVDYYDFAFFDAAHERIESGGADVVVASKARPRRIGPPLHLPPGFDRRIGMVDVLARRAAALGCTRHETAACRGGPTVCRRDRFEGSLFDVELLVRATRAGLKTEELPAEVRELRPPRSSVIRRTLESIAGLARLRLLLGSGRQPRRSRRNWS